VILEDHGAGETLMTIQHEQLPPEQVDSHQRGWGAVAVQLAGVLRGRGTHPAQLGDVLRGRGTHPARSDPQGP
jgi:hypothetical protein